MKQKQSIRSRVCCKVGPSSHRVDEDELRKLIEIADKESTAKGIIAFFAASGHCAEQAERAIEEVAAFIQEYNEKTPRQKIVIRGIPVTDTPPTYPIGFIIRCHKL